MATQSNNLEALTRNNGPKRRQRSDNLWRIHGKGIPESEPILLAGIARKQKNQIVSAGRTNSALLLPSAGHGYF
jgi:hypothetical protein